MSSEVRERMESPDVAGDRSDFARRGTEDSRPRRRGTCRDLFATVEGRERVDNVGERSSDKTKKEDWR